MKRSGSVKTVMIEIKKINLKRNQDDRGILDQIYDSNLPAEVKRIYAVYNFSKETIRGFHKNLNEWKYFYVLIGSVKFVLIENGNKIQEFILSDKVPEILIIPPNVWNGFKALEDNTLVLGLSSATLLEHRDERMPIGSYKRYFEVKSR